MFITSKKWAEKKAQALKIYVANYISGCDVESQYVSILKGRIEDVKYHQKKVKDILEQMIHISKDLPEIEILRSIPGIGVITAIQLIAEIGDINNFCHPKKLVAYAGIDPRVYQSGKYEGHGLKITKKGSKHLRTTIYLVVRSHLQHATEASAIKHFYKKKMQQGKPPKVASIACCNKLLKIIYYLLINGCFYTEQ